jgi:hypothetical protein
VGRIAKALGVQMRTEVEMSADGRSLQDRDGNPVMSRTDPATGLALGFAARGFDGRGTPDQTRSRGLRSQPDDQNKEN